jgi:hypothetical protein
MEKVKPYQFLTRMNKRKSAHEEPKLKSKSECAYNSAGQSKPKENRHELRNSQRDCLHVSVLNAPGQARTAKSLKNHARLSGS